MELVQVGEGWEWRPRASKVVSRRSKPSVVAYKGPQPVVTTAPIKVVDAPAITISEFFGNVSSKTSDASFALATVHRAIGPWEMAWQAPRFAEYVIVTSGSLDLYTVHEDGCQLDKTHVPAGCGVYLPAGLRAKWAWPEPCTYTVVCAPAYSALASGTEAPIDENLKAPIDEAARAKLAQMHRSAEAQSSSPRPSPAAAAPTLPKGITPLVVKPVPVVEAPGITIYEHFGNVASSDPRASLGRAVVKGASQEAWQAPQFDEYVICTKGSIKFLYGDGQQARIAAGQGVFLPKDLRVKWVWPEATEYSVLCLPAFTPEGCGREAEEAATNAKDSASMTRLQQLHAKSRGAP